MLDGLDLTSIVDDPRLPTPGSSRHRRRPDDPRAPRPAGAHVASLDAMDYPDFDIVVVDNRAGRAPLTAGTGLHAPPPGPRRRRARPGISSARNRGVAQSTGAFVAFTDDDAVVEPGWLRALGSRFANEPDVDAIGGLVLPSELDTEPQLWFEEFYGGSANPSDAHRRASAARARPTRSSPTRRVASVPGATWPSAATCSSGSAAST